MRTTIRVALISAIAMFALPAMADATWPGQNGKVIFTCASVTDQDICSINPDGSGLADLTNTADVDESQAEVSKDGTQISFIRGSAAATRVWVANLDGSSSHMVTDVQSDGTAWTPDGKIAYRAKVSDSDFEFRLVPAAGGTSTFLKTSNGSELPPRYTSDGRWLYLKTAPLPPDGLTFTYQVFVMDGMTETQVTPSIVGQMSNAFPSWSPDGASIIYSRSDFTVGFGNDDDIFKIPSAGGAEAQLTNTNGPVKERGASLSPDGNKLLYHEETGPPHDYFHQFMTISDADGSNPVPVPTPTLKSATFPVWAPVLDDPPPGAGLGAFTATAPKKSKALKPVPVTLRCTGATQCVVDYGASLKVSRKKKSPKKFTIKSKTVTLEAHTNKVVNLKVPGSAKGLVKKALKAGKSPKLKAVATANYPGGQLIRKVTLNIGLRK